MNRHFSRREWMHTAVAGAGIAALSRFSWASGAAPQSQAAEEPLPFIDPQPIDPKRPALKWEDLREWMTPERDFFAVSHYGTARVAPESWRLTVDGLVDRPLQLSLDELKSRPKREVVATLECSGNGASPTFMGAIGNARWAGASLADLLKDAAVKPEAAEVAFWGADQGKEKIRGQEYEQHFARSLSPADAAGPDVILAWEMNGKPLPTEHGAPLRLVVPGWYGIAWVKWLTHIEVRDRRLMNRFMARDYVTVRGRKEGDAVHYTETSVGPLNVKSMVGRVTRRSDGSIRVTGAAWSQSAVTGVELKIDNGSWTPVQLDETQRAAHAWTFWSYEWKNPSPGEHTLVCRATDAAGRVQPAADDDLIQLKKTYWEANQQHPRTIRI